MGLVLSDFNISEAIVKEKTAIINSLSVTFMTFASKKCKCYSTPSILSAWKRESFVN